MDKRIDCNSCPLNGIGTDELCEQYCSDMADFIDEIRADAIVEFVTRFEYENITDANAERLKPFIFEMHRLAEKMQKGAEE